jgi:HSP90 family molecular chaperone
MSGSDWPPRLTVEIEPVLRLFTGESFYASADAALREAVLNSIDAIGRRRETEPDLKQKIEVTFDRSTTRITISDNGEVSVVR